VAYALGTDFDVRIKAMFSARRREIGLNLGYFW